jgi:hypothetical protein
VLAVAPESVLMIVVVDAMERSLMEIRLPAVVTYLSRSRWSLAQDLELAPSAAPRYVTRLLGKTGPER